jgi:hypothetical protein
MVRLKLDHCVIHVSDWTRSNAFYCDVRDPYQSISSISKKVWCRLV